MFLQAHVNNNVNMAEQLHCSEIHSKNIKNMLSKLYISTVQDVIKTHDSELRGQEEAQQRDH